MGTETTPTKLLLERLALGELEGLEAEHRRGELEQDPEVQARLAALAHENEAFFQRFPAQQMLSRIHARLEGGSAAAASGHRARLVGGLLGGVAALTAVMAATVVVVTATSPLHPEDSGNRVKGGQPTLLVHRLATTGVERLEDGAVAEAGDRLQVGYVSGGRKYGVILSIDGAGSVTLHQPAAVSDTTALAPGGEVRLPYGYQLDEAPRFERFFFVTSNEPLSAEEALAAARRMASSPDAEVEPLPLRSVITQQSLTLRKTDR